uniref:ACD shelterin complex subunit and telomerase recruitment factor n=1 Tax=Equus asinus TaxID=9793 RepID=A0A9L0IKT0_EQUAS
MASLGTLVLRPWIRELVLGSEALSSPRAGQLLEVLQDAEGPGPSRAPDTPDVGAALLVSDGTYSVRCLVTREALNTSDWEDKEFGFRGAEGRLLLLQDCDVRVQVAEGGAPAEFYLQVDRFSLLPTEQPRERVTGCNQDPDVQKKLYDCLAEHLSESTSPNAGLSLSQLLDEVQEDQEHQGALVRLAESCLMLAGPCTAPPLTRWATSRRRAMDPPKRHRDGSAFQYEYEPPCASLCGQVQAARLLPQLVAWALNFLMEPQPESELTQM